MIRGTAALSEKGICREDNQDAILSAYVEDAGIFVVADGMGGHFRGELASRTAVSLLKAWWEGIKDCVYSMPFLDVVGDLEKKVREINGEIHRMYQEMGRSGGTTLCLLLICRDAYMALNIGDSRLYRCRGRMCMQVTVDDVWENQSFVRKQALTEDIRKDYRYGKLMQALGADYDVKLSVSTGKMEKRTCFFLCSDGVYRYCEEKWLMSQLKQVRNKKNIESAMANIRKMVYQNGAGDNLSLILVTAEGNDSNRF